MTDSYATASNLTAISVLDVLRGVGRRKRLISSIGILSFAAAFGVAEVVQPTYSTQSQVLVENMETPFDRVQSNQQQPTTTGSGVDDRVVASQIAVLKSDDLGRRVVAALKLDERPEFNPLIKGLGMVSRLKIKLGFSDDPALETPEQRAIDRYSDKLSIYQEPQSNVINIKYTSTDPQAAADVANTLAQVYVMATRESQSQPTERARDWLAQQIAELRTKLSDAERKVEEFRSEAGLLQSTTTTLNTQQISDLNTQITVAQTASADAKARADAIRQQLDKYGSVDGSSEVLNSPVIQRLKEQRTTAAQELAQLNAVYLPSHPKLIAARKALADIDAQMNVEARKIVTGLEEQARIAEAREQSLKASLEELKSRESSSNLDDVKLKALERDAAADRALLETMLARYAEASSRQDAASQPGLARIIESASVPSSPSFPKRGPMVLVATIAGLALGFGLTFLLEMMRAASNLTRRLEAAAESNHMDAQAPHHSAPPPAAPPAMAVVAAPVAPKPAEAAKPRPVQAAEAVQAAPASAPASGALRRVMPPLATFMSATGADRESLLSHPEYVAATAALAAWVTNSRAEMGVRRIGISSLAGDGGSGFAAVAIARAIAGGGKRVVIVDAARMGSAVEKLTGVAAGPGLVDLMSGAADFTKVFGRDTQSTVHVLRYGNDRSDTTFPSVVQRLDQVLSALGPLYDFIIVDAGDSRDQATDLLGKCEATVLLTPVLHISEAVEASRALEARGVKSGRYALVA